MVVASQLNILVLGQSGTGKSTLINSIANYLTYETFQDALDAVNPICLIPSSFLLTDDETYQQIRVTMGTSDANEATHEALSCTKAPKVYSFQQGDQKLNIIDVPGIGDTAGTDQDIENTKMILDTVSLFKELHAICILLKATDTRMTTEYQYCLSELLMHLHKSALRNVVFVFTNTRGSDYKPGPALSPLKEYLKKLEDAKGIKIELKKDIMYCIDNEAFRFQCAYAQHKEFRQVDNTNFAQSWIKSREAVFRLVDYMKGLNPHNVTETLSINDARAVILLLVQPLAVICSLIQTNTANYEDNYDQIVDQLQKNLAISDFDIVLEELPRPRTVCTEKRCIGVEKLAGTDQYVTYYKQICHETCYLDNVPLKRCPEPALKHCWAMASTDSCRQCGCHYTKHMHIDFNQKVVLKRSALSETFGILTKEAAVAKLKSTIEELKKEQTIVTDTMIKFGGFLQANAIWEYNEDIDERLKMEIRKEEAANNTAIVNRLKAVYDDYKKRQKLLEATIRTANGQCEITPEEVGDLRDALFELPLHGGKIQELYNKGRNCNAENYTDKSFVNVMANHMPDF